MSPSRVQNFRTAARHNLQSRTTVQLTGNIGDSGSQ